MKVEKLRRVNDPEAAGADDKPALLVSFVYLHSFLKHRHLYSYRNWALDSGAFSAKNSGVVIRLDEYIETCKRLLSEDETLVEVFALDVIGDWRKTIANTEAMWKAGVPAIPTFHVGEPQIFLLEIARSFPKIALGGAVGYKRKEEWAEQCFARVYPKAIHGFGFGAENSIIRLPFHSIDASNWEVGPCKYGKWRAFGQLSVRGSSQNLRAEVERYLSLEKLARARWREEMKQFKKVDFTHRLSDQNIIANNVRRFSRALDEAPILRLSDANNGTGTERRVLAFGKRLLEKQHE